MTVKTANRAPAPNRLGYGMVRDSDGNPIIEGNLKKLPAGLKIMLSPAERSDQGVWPHEFGDGSQGEGRLQLVGPGQFKALDKIVALSVVHVHGQDPIHIIPRTDLAVGDIIKIEGD